jgi:phage gp29-like protein
MTRIWPKTIRGLTLEVLNRQLEAYTNGFLADFALTCDAMQERDDVLKNVIAKRKKAVARHGWEVHPS